MSIIAMPASVRIRHVDWSLDRPAQVNRSPYSGARRVMANPWHGRWSAGVELAPIIGEANVRAWRAFLASLKGQINTFQLPATEGPQYVAGSLNGVVANRTGTTVTALGGGVYRLTKTATTGTYGNAEANSANVMAGDFVIRVFPTAATFGSVLGVEAPVNSFPPLIGLRADSDGTLFKTTSAAHTPVGTFTLGTDNLFLRRVGSTVTILKGPSTDVALATLVATHAPLTGTVNFGSDLYTAGAVADVLVSYSQSFATVASGGAQGATSATLANASTALTAGMLVTFTLPSGNKQLVALTADIAAGVVNFEPALRESAAVGSVVETASPTCQVALSDSAFSWSVDPGQLYNIRFGADEAF